MMKKTGRPWFAMRWVPPAQAGRPPRGLAVPAVLPAAVLALSFAGCTETPQSLDLRPLESGTFSGVHDEALDFRLIGNETEFWALYREIHAGTLPAPEPPAVDFHSDYVLAGFMGQRSTGGYSIELKPEAIERGETARVTVELTSPPEGAMVPQVITSPYVLALLPRSDYRRVEVSSAAGARLVVLDAP